MGTTRIKVIDLSSDQAEIKTARKHAGKLGAKKIKEEKPGQAEELHASEQAGKAQNKQTAIQAETSEAQIPTTQQDSQAEVAQETKKAPTPKTNNDNRHKGKKYQKAASIVEDKKYAPKEAFGLLPQTSFTKFDPSVEVHLNILEKNTKLTVNMPHLTTVKKQVHNYLIFCEKKPLPEDVQAIWGDDKTIGQIESGQLKPGKDFDSVIASPKFMPKLAKVAKILGPKGLMPNPKNGTITENPKDLFDSKKTATGTTVKTDPTSPVVHVKIGKLSQKTEELEANFKALVTAIGPTKIKKATLTTTMGPAIHLDPTKITFQI